MGLPITHQALRKVGIYDSPWRAYWKTVAIYDAEGIV